MMRFLPLTFLYGMLTVFSADSVLEFPSSSPATTLEPATANAAAPAITNMVYQSTDGGKTWQDISNSLPENGQLESFFAGESEVYLSVRNKMYRSQSNLKTPVWEEENVPDPVNALIAFNRSGVMAYNYDGEIYQKMPAAKTWVLAYPSFKEHLVNSIFETADGTLFVGCVNGLYKSADKGRSWKHVKNEGWVMNVVESKGVLIATGQKGIMRSTDNGEHWEWVISEGGVGIAVERIDGGFAAISYNTASKSRRIRISMDSGKTWQAIDEDLPSSSSISSIKQVGGYLLCSHPDGIFRSSDKGKTWTIVHSGVDRQQFQYGGILNIDLFKDQRKVFKLHVSGNVVYAVAREAGC